MDGELPFARRLRIPRPMATQRPLHLIRFRDYRWSEMRKLVVLLTIVALVSSAMTVLAGCGSSAPTDQPAAAPTETTWLLLKPTATVSTPLVDDSVSTPTPASPADDGIEFAPVDSLGTSGKQESIAVAEPDSPQKGQPRRHRTCPG